MTGWDVDGACGGFSCRTATAIDSPAGRTAGFGGDSDPRRFGVAVGTGGGTDDCSRGKVLPISGRATFPVPGTRRSELFSAENSREPSLLGRVRLGEASGISACERTAAGTSAASLVSADSVLGSVTFDIGENIAGRIGWETGAIPSVRAASRSKKLPFTQPSPDKTGDVLQ